MQSAKLHILSISCLLGAALVNSSCTPLFKGRETQSAATMGGKQVISPKPRKKAPPKATSSASESEVNVTQVRPPAATTHTANIADSKPKASTPPMVAATPEKLTPQPAPARNRIPSMAITPAKPSQDFATAPTVRPAPTPKTIQIKPEPQRMIPKQSRPPEPSLTMSKETKPIEKMAKSSVPKPNFTEPEKLGPIVIADERANRIVNANGRDVVIQCSNGVVVISGGCNKLTLSGDRNQVQCDSANEVELTGHVNTIVVGLLGTGNISGDRNTLSWGAGVRSGDPRLETKGFDNVLERLE